MSNGMIKSKGMKTSFYSAARERMRDMGKGLLTNPAIAIRRIKLGKLQKKLTNINK